MSSEIQIAKVIINMPNVLWWLRNLAEEIKYLRPDQERDRSFFVDKASGVELEVMETMEFIEWLVETDETWVFL